MFAWGFGFRMWRLTLFPRLHVPTACRLLCSNVGDLAGNLSDLTVASSQYDILLCSETLVSDMRHLSELLVPGFRRPVLLCRGKMPGAPRDGGVRTKWIWSISPTQVLSVVVEKYCFLGFVVWYRIYVFSLYRNPDLDDRILTVYKHQWLLCRLRICVPLSSLWMIWMAIRSGWVLQPQIVMVLQLLTSQLWLVAISWLSARPMHVMEHLTSWWLMFMT